MFAGDTQNIENRLNLVDCQRMCKHHIEKQKTANNKIGNKKGTHVPFYVENRYAQRAGEINVIPLLRVAIRLCLFFPKGKYRDQNGRKLLFLNT